jgi:hypothetical protein
VARVSDVPASPLDEAATPAAAALLLGIQEDELDLSNRMLVQDISDPLGINDAAYQYL